MSDERKIVVIPLDELNERFSALEKNIEAKLTLLKPKQEVKPPIEKYLTRKETAVLFRVSLPTLGEYVKRGILTAYKIGSRVLFKEYEVIEALRKVNVHIVSK